MASVSFCKFCRFRLDQELSVIEMKLDQLQTYSQMNSLPVSGYHSIAEPAGKLGCVSMYLCSNKLVMLETPKGVAFHFKPREKGTVPVFASH